PRQDRDDDGDEDQEAAHRRRAALGEVALRTVGADRLALPLGRAQPADELRTQQKPDEQRRRARRTRAKADVADEVQDAGEAELVGDHVEHAKPPATRSTSFASPTELDAFTSTASPGWRVRIKVSVASSTSSARSSASLPTTCSASGFISSPSRIRQSMLAPSTAGASAAWSAALCSPSSRIGPSTAIRRLTSRSSPKLFNVAVIDAGLAL